MANVVDCKTHLLFCAANRAGDTIEVVTGRDGTVWLDVMSAATTKSGYQASIKLDARQSAELREFLNRDYRTLQRKPRKIVKSKPSAATK